MAKIPKQLTEQAGIDSLCDYGMAEGKVCRQIIREDARGTPVAEKPTSLSSGVVERLTDLDSSQEEADTRLLLHAAHSARSKFIAVIIVSEDTDVSVLCLAFKSFIPSSMFIKCSSKTRVKYLDVSRIVERIGASTCKSLPGFHAFTGGDTVSAFQRRGKVLVFRIVAQDQGFQEVFQGLGGSGSRLKSFTVTSRGSTVPCTARMREQMKSTSCDTGCSA